MMKGAESITVFVPSLAGGGAEKMMVNLANEFASRDYDVDIVLATAEGPFVDRVAADVNIVDLNAPEPPGFNLLGAVPGLVQYLRRVRPSAMLSALNRSNIVSILSTTLARTETTVVVSERNHLSRYLEHASKKERVAIPKLISATYPRADSVVAISSGVADDLAKRVNLPRKNIDVIHNPAFSPEIAQKSMEPVSHPFLDSDAPVVIAVGSLTVQKDFLTLLRAFNRLYAERDARLLILGEGEQRETLETEMRKLGIKKFVDMPGFVDNPYPYMRRSDVFTLSSAWEGFGNVVVEALACGCPVVSTDCPSGPAEILDNGRYGPLVPVGADKELAEAIEAVLDDPPDEDLLRNRARDFSTDVVADRYLDVLFEPVLSLS
jgi:glycosyltransferase involved in cell wall biosynthesis